MGIAFGIVAFIVAAALMVKRRSWKIGRKSGNDDLWMEAAMVFAMSILASTGTTLIGIALASNLEVVIGVLVGVALAFGSVVVIKKALERVESSN